MDKKPEVRAVTAERGLAWITDGWRLFARAPGPWIGMIVVTMLIFMGCSLLPLVGNLIGPFVQTLLSAGMLLGARRLQREGTLRVGDLFSALSHEACKPLLVLAAIYLLLYLGAFALMFLFGLGGALLAGIGGLISNDPAAVTSVIGALGIALLMLLLLSMPILAMYWFAVPLVVLGGVRPWDAMIQSLTACLANMMPMLVYGLVGLLLLIIGSLPLLLGLLIVGPVLAASWLTSYQDIFETG